MNDDTKNVPAEPSDAEVEKLLADAKALNEEIAAYGAQTDAKLNELEAGVDQDAAKIESAATELEATESEAEGELEDLMLDEAEDLAKE